MGMEYTKHFIFLNVWVFNIQEYSKRIEKKLDTKRKKMIFVGYSSTNKRYHL